MSEGPASWQVRGRAESFGAVAEEYDAVRARYPAEVVDAVLAGRPPSPPAVPGPVRVLDVGTGTGILARALLAAGALVVGSDVDDGMAAVARRSGLTVHVGPFERLDLTERFDRVTVAQAWHWIEPEAGLAAVRRALAPGGQLWLIWNVGDLAAPVQAATDEVYRRFGPELSGLEGLKGGCEGGLDGGAVRASVTSPAAAAAGRFFGAVAGARVSTLAVPWSSQVPTARWIRLVSTYSDHATLPADVRGRLLAALSAAVDSTGGVVRTEYTTRVVVVAGLSQ